jgi:HSP20 family molecular chaperone IbpA
MRPVPSGSLGWDEETTTLAELMRTNAGQNRPAPVSDWLGWDPFRALFGNYGGSAGLEITRTDTGYTVEVPVPGYKPDQIDVTLENGVLSVVGKAEKRSFTRTLLLPDEIDPDNVGARVEHGMLTLSLNVHPKAQPKKIEINTGE